MRCILQELWYGNVCTDAGIRALSPGVKELMGNVTDHYRNLLQTLTGRQGGNFGEI